MTTQSHNELSDADLAHILGFSLSEQQLSAVKAPREPAVMVAGAGSGKTTSMSARIAFLIGSGYLTPEQDLGLTFTTKATAQLLESARSRISFISRCRKDRSSSVIVGLMALSCPLILQDER